MHILKPRTVFLASLALSAVGLQVAHAQTASNTTRAEVKAEAIAAAASKPKGEMSTPNQDKAMPARSSNTTRAAVKAEAAASKPMTTEGERSVPKKMSAQQPPMSTNAPSAKKRAEVKAETQAEVKANPGGLSRGKGVEDAKAAASAAGKPTP